MKTNTEISTAYLSLQFTAASTGRERAAIDALEVKGIPGLIAFCAARGDDLGTVAMLLDLEVDVLEQHAKAYANARFGVSNER